MWDVRVSNVEAVCKEEPRVKEDESINDAFKEEQMAYKLRFGVEEIPEMQRQRNHI